MLTTPVWDSFAAFCRDEGLEPDAVKNLFRTIPRRSRTCAELETGRLSENDFEAIFGQSPRARATPTT